MGRGEPQLAAHEAVSCHPLTHRPTHTCLQNAGTARTVSAYEKLLRYKDELLEALREAREVGLGAQHPIAVCRGSWAWARGM